VAILVSDRALTKVKESAPIGRHREDYDFDQLIGNARYVLVGEASHGTHEFYKVRAEITKRLVAENNFTVVAWEADWPDALSVSRYIRRNGRDGDAEESLCGFQRFRRGCGATQTF
jgi:erythromycin esterase-like protein